MKQMQKNQLQRQLQETVAKLTSCHNENKRLGFYAFTSRLLPDDDINLKNRNAKSNGDEQLHKTNVDVKCNVSDEQAAESCNQRINTNNG